MEFVNYQPKNTVWLWDPPENLAKHKSNIRKLGKKWTYRKKDISYKFNSHGFRTREFSEIDWKNSIVVIGDSKVFGTGLAEEDTICSKIEQLSGIYTVNLGISGSAIDTAMFNSITLYNNFPKPKALVHIWTSLARYTNFNINGSVNSVLPRYNSYYSNMDWISRSKLYMQVERSIWKNTVPRYEGSFFTDTQEAFDSIHKLKIIDYARDLEHPGIESIDVAAKHIIKFLNL